MLASFSEMQIQHRRKVALQIEAGGFIIKTVENQEELQRVLKLRYEVFFKEFRSAPQPEEGVDVDEFDSICDHLIILDPKEDRLVGTYRLICSDFSDKFYSQNEFTIGEFLKQPGVKLELGRACIDKSYRSGMVMALLWRGLAAYMRETKADYLFGCTSVKTMDPKVVSAIQSHLQGLGALTDDFGIGTTPDYTMSMPKDVDVGNSVVADEYIPSLLLAYLKAGAKVVRQPALDKEFECVDFFTVLCTDQMNKAHERRYQL